MASRYVSRLSGQERVKLIDTLLEIQSSNCFICGKVIDRSVERIDIDHIEPITVGGKDSKENFAVTHEGCNRAKQASDLRVARIMASFDSLAELKNRALNLGDILTDRGGGRYDLACSLNSSHLSISFSETGQQNIVELPIHVDKLSGFSYVFVNVPIEYLHHDDRINPRPIGRNLKQLVEEFHKKLPQLHVALGWIDTSERPKINVFDGQHKAAAQILLGTKQLPIRLFINPDKDRLLTANTRAGTTLRQVAFDKSVQRSLGSSLLADRMRRYREDKNLGEDFELFSENDLVNHFKGESREMRKYVLDWVRNSVTTHKQNKLRDYIEYGGRKKDVPFSYSTVEKTFYSFFVYSGMLNTPFNHRVEEGKNPRSMEIDQLVNLMNIVAERVYIGKFDPDRGTRRIEHDIQHGKDVPDDHLRAFRMAKEEVLHTWLRYVKQVVHHFFITIGTPVSEEKILQYCLPEGCWNNVRNFIDSLSRLPLWVNHDLSHTAFGSKRNYDYWQSVFETGKTPEGSKIMSDGICLIKMIQERGV